MRRLLPALLLALALSPARAEDVGLEPPPPPASAARPAAATTQPDLSGTWTCGDVDRPGEHHGAPGTAVFAKVPGQENAYTVRLVANAGDGSLDAEALSAKLQGSQLVLSWTPRTHIATQGFVNHLDGTSQAAGTPPGAHLGHAVFTLTSDADFDRLRPVSGDPLPDGIASPREIRRPRPPEVIFPAEWELSEEILWGYRDAFSVSQIYKAALRGCAANGETVKHRFYVKSADDQHHLSYELGEEFGPGPELKLVLYHVYPIGSVWMRDYGPWTVKRKKDRRRILGDTGYFSEREADDRMPVDYAHLRGWERLDLSALKIEGGNIMSDGRGRLFTSGRTLEGTERGANPTQEGVESNLRKLGATSVIFLERMPEPEGTGHMDMFSKLTDEHTVVVGRTENPEYRAVLERNAQKFATLGYRVVRLDMARPEKVTGVRAAGLGLMTYTNSLFVGRTVLVTQYKDAERDRAALDAYRTLGWKPVGIDVRSIIHANGAIHCISMQVVGP
jgi:agmatine/peptidylarginine deiminase